MNTPQSHGAQPVVSLDPARLPSFAASTARQHRLAVDERLEAALAHTHGLTGWTIATHNVIASDRAAIVQLRWCTQLASVRIDIAQHPELTSVFSPHAGKNAALRHAVGALLLAPLARAFESLGIAGVDVVAVDRAPDAGAQSCCSLTFRLGERRIDATLEHIDTGWLDALERFVDRQFTPYAQRVSEIVIPGRVTIGERMMNVTQLDSLREGDVILRFVAQHVTAMLRQAAGPAQVELAWGCYGTRQLRAKVDMTHQSLTLIEDPTVSHDTRINAPLTDSIDSPVGISDLDLPLKLEIDTVSMPVAQLSALRAGYVLELPTQIPDARVRLVTYGQTIAFGELVSVGDHLGVRLTQLPRGHGSIQ
ncbi:YscQ/HrcQ family type III secretion apparatus protein [Burkholderia sp. Ac-20384]|uniref:type III secretion system cytoplasmic ring protein SctQ n=1 Tax=Burkholderia sp. Ac-20384 TaxID=2703902 RepID=UPI001980B014|nr:type III secretion system cytoplasmic ring protein SctQ [Burkholderia sp. Ac-20384]MBN3825123.1 YscQ/HrcQ family type III secretion apparatus protein [Burkholderia sp. Ac-20384]